MKSCLLFPPQWTPLSPYYALSSLAGQLRHNNYDVDIKDLNIDFYNKLLTPENLIKVQDYIEAEFDDLVEEMKREKSDSDTYDGQTERFKKMLVKFLKMKEFKTSREEELKKIPHLIGNALDIMRCKERFYRPDLLAESMHVIDIALEIASIPYLPSQISFANFNNPFMKLTYDSLYEHCKEDLMFRDYYTGRLQEIINGQYDLISISINSNSQLIGGLTLAMMLKEQVNAHINIGGNYFGRVVDTLLDKPEFFETFCDSINVGEGEGPIVEIAKYVEGKIQAEDVPNFLWIKEGKVVKNPDKPPIPLEQMQNQDLTGFDLEKYLAPDIVIPTQTSRGCYWRKCSFCDHDFGQYLNVKSVDKVVEHFKELNEKFGITHFEIIDESISPEYLENLSKKIIESGLKIYWFNNARLETEFTKKRLELAYEAGLRMLLWGFESGSERIMKLINKGIDIKKRLDILRDAKDSGIWNFAFIFFGFPSETEEEAMETIDTICNNTDLIMSYGRSIFTLGKHTRLKDNPERYFITEIVADEQELSPSYSFKVSQGMNQSEVSKMGNLCTNRAREAYGGYPLWMALRYREILFLYICKHGAEDVHAFNFERE